MLSLDMLQDEDGRSYCDSFLDMPSMPEEEITEGEDKDKLTLSVNKYL